MEALLPWCQAQAGFCRFPLQKQAEPGRNSVNSILFTLRPGAQKQAGAWKKTQAASFPNTLVHLNQPRRVAGGTGPGLPGRSQQPCGPSLLPRQRSADLGRDPTFTGRSSRRVHPVSSPQGDGDTNQKAEDQKAEARNSNASRCFFLRGRKPDDAVSEHVQINGINFFCSSGSSGRWCLMGLEPLHSAASWAAGPEGSSLHSRTAAQRPIFC